ncbi:MAG TPA: tetratricopeptide repeat protein [Polyangiaceae bacterium]
MAAPRAVVIPFGVPDEGRGLGLGLAALLHTCVQVDGGGLAVAQLHARRKDEPKTEAPVPVEAFVPPAAWKDIAGRGDAPPGVQIVLTGAFEPPVDGHGAIRLLAFDAKDGTERASVEAQLDGLHAGASLAGAFELLGERLGGEMGALGALRELEWDALESVLRAERCALHDPLRGGPHDRLAAMLHLGRAIGDAPSGRYAAGRLASIALEAASFAGLDPKLGGAAVRALTRAVDDARGEDGGWPRHVELVEALAALELRAGKAREAERRLEEAIAAFPSRARLYVLLAQSLRAQGQIDGALGVVQAGQAASGGDPVLSAERGVILASRGNVGGAAVAWREAMTRDPVQPAAFTNLALLALRTQDAATAQQLVDAALASVRAHPDVLRRAIQLAIASEAEGIARASRVARLCTRLLEMIPDEPWASLALAKSEQALGDVAGARVRLAAIEKGAPGSAAAAEAMAARFAIEHPEGEREVQSVLRAAQSAALDDLAEVASRARRVATLQESWPAWVAAAVADRRLGRWTTAKHALEVALQLAPGATAAHVELAEALLQLGDRAGAEEHAKRVLAVEGDSARAAAVLERARAAKPASVFTRLERAWARLTGRGETGSSEDQKG